MALEVDSVRRRFGPVAALAGVSLTVEPGTVHCLAGPNGAGKTTLLRVVLGLTRPSAGSVRVDGTCRAAFQTPSVFLDLTVGENLSAVAGMAGGVDGEWRDHVVDRLGLDPVRDRIARDLSAGYRKRLDVAAGLITGHDYLVCDEPLGDVDAPTRDRLVELLDEMAGGVLVATHDLEPFDDVCDRLTVLSGGRVLSDERTATLARDLDVHYAQTLAEQSPDRS